MARIRSIKPEMPQSESMGRVSRDARLLFILTWTLADDEGRLRGSSRMLASLLFPYDDDAPGLIDGWLDELVREDCIILFEVDGSTYLQICKWLIHQKIDKPSKSKIPEVGDNSRILASPRGGIKDQGSRIKDQGKEGITPLSNASTGLPDPDPANLTDSVSSAIPDPVDLLGETIDTGKPTLTVVKPRPADIVFEHWKRVMAHPQAKLDNKRLRAISARIKDGYTVDQLMLAVDGCLYSPHHQGANDRNTVYDDIELICRDGPHVDGFLKIASRGPPRAPDGMSDNTRKQVDNLKRYMENHPDE